MEKQKRVTVAEMQWVAEHLDRRDPEAAEYWRELAKEEEARLRRVPVVTSDRYRMGRPFGIIRA